MQSSCSYVLHAPRQAKLLPAGSYLAPQRPGACCPQRHTSAAPPATLLRATPPGACKKQKMNVQNKCQRCVRTHVAC